MSQSFQKQLSKDKSKKDRIIRDILAKLPKDENQRAFFELILQPMSVRTLCHVDGAELSKLLQDRYQYFLEHSHTTTPTCRLFMDPYRFSWTKGQYLLEVVCPDAPYLFQTVENLLRSYGLRITRKLHPIIGVQGSKKKMQLSAASDAEQKVSFMYFSFEPPSVQQLEAMQEDILNRCAAVLSFEHDQATMGKKIQAVKALVDDSRPKVVEPKSEWLSLLGWLESDTFSFFGYCESKVGEELSLSKRLGILSPSISKAFPGFVTAVKQHLQDYTDDSDDFCFDRVQYNSPVQRFDPLMHLRFSFPKLGKSFHFFGLLRRSSLLSKNSNTPLIHLKMAYIFKTRQFLPGSHDYNEVIRIFTAIPKYELFRIPQELLLAIVDEMLSITNPNHIQTYFHSLSEQRVFCLMVVPPFLFTQGNIEKIKDFIHEHIPNMEQEVLSIQAEGRCRLHVYLKLKEAGQALPSAESVERELGEVLLPWKERVKAQFSQKYPDHVEGIQRYLESIPDHYAARSHPSGAADDLHAMSLLCEDNPIECRFKLFTYPPESELAHKASILKVFSHEKIDLMTIIPIIQNLGFYVIDELTARFMAKDGETTGFISSFRVQNHNREPVDPEKYGPLIVESLLSIFHGRVEDDPLNALVLNAKLCIQDVSVLLMYRNLYTQLSRGFSRGKVNQSLLKYPEISRFFVQYFEQRFAPHVKKRESVENLKKILEKYLKPVNELADDRIIRHLFKLLAATVRTNVYQDDVIEDYPLAIKFHTQEVSFAPDPKPEREIFVYDRLVEGTHLRFGSVARGGIRWSDREYDFRTEILGLVKTQQVKNVVIVPVGSKGGFIAKQHSFYPSDGLPVDFYYRRFVKGLLSITDNREQGKVVHPEQSVCYDGEDPYFVIAADKGTAKFSDSANDVAVNHGFWLGDAFASGGSNGYDHKKVGITAKGAWECAQRHFVEQELILGEHTFTCVGVGDMSGDVFGNGMLLCEDLQLIAAFNHMHIFIDPNPDTKTSFKERKRLFETPNTTWKDYKDLSKGGGVYDRDAKEINLSKEAQKALGISQSVMSGHELIKTILRASVDFIWFGGIGTYIKSSNESHTHVGDLANNDVRIDATECNARIICEGANLGCTQKGRIEFSLLGGAINTDAIDNSAGVNMSDYEVNLKILMAELMDAKKIDFKKRNKLLSQYTDAVTDKVLMNNYEQHQLLSLDQLRSKRDPRLFSDLIEWMVEQGICPRKEEDLPETETLHEWVNNGQVFPRPILAILQAYTKMEFLSAAIDMDLVKDPHMQPLLMDYFPKAFSKEFAKEVAAHPLRDNIIVTQMVNKMVNYAGSSFLYVLKQRTHADTQTILRVYLVVEQVLGATQIRDDIQNSKASVDAQYKALLFISDVILTICRDLLQSTVGRQLNISDIEHLQSLAKRLASVQHLLGADQSAIWKDAGFSSKLSERLASLPSLEILPEFVHIHDESSHHISHLASLLFLVNEQFQISWIDQHLKQLLLKTYWDREQQALLLSSLFHAKCQMVIRIADRSSKQCEISNRDELYRCFPDDCATQIRQYFDMLDRLQSEPDAIDLLSLSALVTQLQVLS